MKKITLLIIFVFLVTKDHLARTDENGKIIRSGLLTTQLTLSPSRLFSNGQLFYLHGGIEGYLNDNLSISGDGYYYLGILSPENKEFDFMHNLFSGVFWHFTKKNNDFYIGFQPGVSIVKLNSETFNLATTKTGINPVISPVFGYRFFLGDFFHFYTQARFVFGENNYYLHKRIDEFRFSAGLGFNINTTEIKSVPLFF